jgi:hypothetical protein
MQKLYHPIYVRQRSDALMRAMGEQSYEEEVNALKALRATRRSKIDTYPSLSVVISTARPTDFSQILNQLTKQKLPHFELVIGIHDFTINTKHKALIRKLESRAVDVKVKSFEKHETLGSILSVLAADSSGQYISKMDDDDIYGPEHLQDLLDALLDKGADVAGRAMNYIYIEDLDLTTRKILATGISSIEEWDDWVCGGTILVKREAGESAGWFGEGKSAVDKFLLSGVKSRGGRIFRTYGNGYIYRRSLTPQTYVTHYSKYLNNSIEQRTGIWRSEEFGTDT